ncbi:MAG: TolC family protein [Candidatus Krumholzibacteriota bacterium]|nr:TolC family protein [Candidatus Krumholzibacteriota bacterium]
MRVPSLTAASLLALLAAAQGAIAQDTAAQGAAAQEAAAESAADSLTLERCLELALRRAPSLQASREAEGAAQAAAAEAAARRLPRLDLGGSYRYSSDVMVKRIDMGALGSNELRFGDHHQADLNVGLSILLYSGGELGLAANAAAAGAQAAAERRSSVALDTRRDVRMAFYAILGRQAQLDAANLAQRRLRRRLSALRGAIAVGSAAAEDSLRVLARLCEAEQRRLQAMAAREAAAVALGRLLGRPGEAVRVAGELERPLIEEGLAAGDSTVLAHPALVALGHESERQRLLARAARSRFLPSLSGDLRGHYGRPGIDPLANDWMRYGTASLILSWTLWDGGQRSRQAQRADAVARQAELLRQDAAEGLQAAYDTARADLAAARCELTTARERVALQSTLLGLVTGRRDRAQATENEVLDAQDDLNEAEIAIATARTRVRQCEATLLWTLGR